MTRCLPDELDRVHEYKRKFLYSAVSNPQDCSKRFTLYFPGRRVQSYIISTSLGSIQPYATINGRINTHHLFIARYSFIQLSELKQCRVNKLAQGFNTAAQDSNPGPISRESGGLPLSHCALHTTRVCVNTVEWSPSRTVLSVSSKSIWKHGSLHL